MQAKITAQNEEKSTKMSKKQMVDRGRDDGLEMPNLRICMHGKREAQF